MSPHEETKNTSLHKCKYELTLSEFPIFMLSKKADKDIRSIDYEDTIVGKDNAIIRREWRVFPDSQHGFGTASTFETLFDLFQIWKEQGLNSQYIQFGSMYHLLKRKGQSTGSRQYRQIIKDLHCLVGIRIAANNAFWDNEHKAYVDMTFHLFDRLDIYKKNADGQDVLPFSRIKASDVFYGSILKNSLLTADFDSTLFHSLTPVEQRLALYLSKIFRSQTIHKRNLLEFAQQIPIHAKRTKHIKERLKKACTGLMKKGFQLLSSYDFEMAVDGKIELIVFRKDSASSHATDIVTCQRKGPIKDEREIDLLVRDILDVCEDEKSANFYRKAARLLPRQDIYRAISGVKELRQWGEIRTSKGAVFTSIIKKYADAQGIFL